MRIRFARYSLRPVKREATSLRVSAAKRALQRERDKVPLYAAQVAATQPSPQERIAIMDEHWCDVIRDWRRREAENWRRCRGALRELPQETRERILFRWNSDRWLPKESHYLANYLHHHGWDIRTGWCSIRMQRIPYDC